MLPTTTLKAEKYAKCFPAPLTFTPDQKQNVDRNLILRKEICFRICHMQRYVMCVCVCVSPTSNLDSISTMCLSNRRTRRRSRILLLLLLLLSL